MNIAMEQTEEYVDGQLKSKYGDCFIRGNNGKIIIARLPWCCFFDICILDTILYQVLTATLHYIPDSALYLQSEEIVTMSATFGCFVEDTHC
jgi:hypothetical protein